jgi:serine/threonine protein kinase
MSQPQGNDPGLPPPTAGGIVADPPGVETASSPSGARPGLEDVGAPADLSETILRDYLDFEGLRETVLERPDGPGDGVAAPGLSVPRMTVGRYQVFEILGKGGFGLVYRADDPTLRQPRALKVPLPEVLASREKRRRFLKDAQALARLDHPNIVRVYDADECGGVCYIAMELCECGSLAGWLQRLREGQAGVPGDADIPAEWAADLVARVAEGVQHAHDRKVYHRDLKPGNILLARRKDDPTSDADGEAEARAFPPFCPKVAISASPRSWTTTRRATRRPATPCSGRSTICRRSRFAATVPPSGRPATSTPWGSSSTNC